MKALPLALPAPRWHTMKAWGNDEFRALLKPLTSEQLFEMLNQQNQFRDSFWGQSSWRDSGAGGRNLSHEEHTEVSQKLNDVTDYLEYRLLENYRQELSARRDAARRAANTRKRNALRKRASLFPETRRAA